MAVSESELVKELTEAGNALLSPPSSPPVPELLSLLDRVEKYLTQVEQSPSESIRKALSPSTKALIGDDLLRHSDVDVKVSTASCISEITRITAPDAPYEDDQMKEVFQLIVSSFEKLDDMNSPSYIKRTSILETVSKVRSCVVMLDLECDSLIAEMFQHFLRSIREHHSENVFSSMETIMTLVLEESEDIPLDLLASILDFLKIQDKEVLPISRQLAEKVIEKCADKLKHYLLPAVKSRGASVNDYSKVVANIIESEAVEPSEGDLASKNVAEISDPASVPVEKPVEVAMETLDDAPPYEEVGPTTAVSPKAVMSNGNVQKEMEDIPVVIDDPKEEDHGANDESKSAEEPSKIVAEILTVEEPAKSEPNKPEETDKQKEKEISSSKIFSEPSEHSLTESQGTIRKHVEQIENKDFDSAHSEDTATNAGEPSETEKESDPPYQKEKESDPPVSPPKILENEEQSDTTSPSPSGSLVNDKLSERGEETKKTDDLVQETELAGDVDSKKESDTEDTTEKAGVQEIELQKETGEKASDKIDDITSADTSKNEDEEAAKVDAKSAKQSGKKVETVSSEREDKKKKGHAKGTSVKVLAKTPARDEGKKPAPKSTPKVNKDESDVEKSSKSGSKRKQSSAGEKASKTKGYGAELVGSKVKVWWPADKAYYTGVIDSFDSVKLRHKVVYTDGDVEILKLARERWALIDDDSPSDEAHASDADSSDESAETPIEKKAKTNATDQGSSKWKKTGTTVKKAGPSSSKSKSTPKSNRKQKEDSKTESKAKEQASKSSGQSKDEDVGSAKGSSKWKQETPKPATKSKGKSPKASSKSNTKGKAASTSKEEVGDEDDSPETTKGKSPSASKSQKGGKKRKRGGRG